MSSLNRWLLLGFVLAAFSLGAFFSIHKPYHSEGPASKDGIAWQTSLSTSMQEAKTSHRPLLVDFYADWCTYCKAMEKVYAKPQIIRLSKNFVCAKVNVDQYPDLTQAFHVDGLPTLIFMKPGTDKTKRLEGYVDDSQLAAVMLQAAR